MAGWFYLGSSYSKHKYQEKENSETNGDNNHPITLQLPYSQNEEGYNKGFEIWPRYNREQQTLTHLSSSFGVSSGSRRRSLSDDLFTSKSAGVVGFGDYTMRQTGGGLGGGMNCQDCGNQAKKDCAHMRCRTCCKSRGFQCQTHVKSTWVPAAKRRERQQLQQHHHHHEDQHRDEHPKRLREIGLPSSSHTPAVRFASSAGLELGQFPSQVSYPAVFRCVRVSTVGDEEQLAYQTAVSIGGHVFRGILYDQGPESRGGGDGTPQPRNLNIGSSSSSNASMMLVNSSYPGASSATTAATFIDPSLYPGPLYIAGTQFFPPPRS